MILSDGDLQTPSRASSSVRPTAMTPLLHDPFWYWIVAVNNKSEAGFIGEHNNMLFACCQVVFRRLKLVGESAETAGLCRASLHRSSD